MVKRLKGILVVLIFMLGLLGQAAAAELGSVRTWRMDDGDLVTVGMSKAEVYNLAGEPDLKDTISRGVDVGIGEPEKEEIWYYFTNNLIYELHFINAELQEIIWDRKR